jgi:hypothetical protein
MLAANTLVHIVGTKAPSDATYRIYVNGAAVTTSGITQQADLALWVSTDRLTVANRNFTSITTDSRPWWGTIHLIAVYDRALSAGEVATNYAVGF